MGKPTVNKNWKPLSETSRQNFREILSSSIPVVINGARGKKKVELQKLLDRLISKIDKKLETLLVPKYSKKANFDYNKIHSQNQTLEMALANELEQINQMEIKLEHETMLLKEDTELLTKLKSDKKAVETRNKMLHRTKLHPLLKNEFKDLVDVDNELIKSHLKPLKDRSLYLWDPEQDHELCEIKKSISSHLRSIEKNTKVMDNVVSKVEETEKILIQLMKKASLESY
ncbi:kinetochore protein fta7 [Gigaspora margarita]|uniref:Kinetochore protein fta7 n=1 Tax=Gigaspora margarita TaxID=4874 RepID=A0A8H4AH76_GIGMA|nr:kinetochore protein fta7 [Gigaspora margarita]